MSLGTHPFAVGRIMLILVNVLPLVVNRAIDQRRLLQEKQRIEKELGIYDLAQNEGFVSVGDSHDTAEFAVETIRRWWAEVGSLAYPDAERLLITADAGGSNSYRSRLWRLELSKLAAEAGIDITVCHFPPGTSKWNKIEHRLFSAISTNWRGRPLESHEVIVDLIAAIARSS